MLQPRVEPSKTSRIRAAHDANPALDERALARLLGLLTSDILTALGRDPKPRKKSRVWPWPMSYRLIPPETLVSEYEPPTLRVACERCKRDAPELKVQSLRRRFGSNLTLGQLALKVALSGKAPCGLAETGQCGARAWEPPPWHWADLDRAWKGGWMARLYCRRHRGGVKASKPCPEVVIVDVETLVATLGYDFKLEHLRSRLQCPRCHSTLIDVEWIVPDALPPPFAPAADVVPLRLKPTAAQRASRILKVIDGRRPTEYATRRPPYRT